MAKAQRVEHDETLDWESFSLEHKIELALRELGANDHLKNAVKTKMIAEQLALMGCPGDEILRGIEINKLARSKSSPSEKVKVNDTDGKKYIWRGARWVGSIDPAAPYDQHQWALPLWEKIGA